MANLIVDIGNTFTKILVFSGNQIVFSDRKETFSISELESTVEKFRINQVIISSVRSDADFGGLRHISNAVVIQFNNNTPVPISNLYETPETLGVDRLAGVIGAKEIFPDKAVLAIDFGSCITFDFIDEKGVYYGGSISPGLKMRFKAMHHFTGKLPEVDDAKSTKDFSATFGKNTKESLQAGVVNGILFEIEGYIKKYNEISGDLKVILCGGDSSFFDSRLKNSIFAHQILVEPNLVPIGLNTVVKYQYDQTN
ncbi:putative transcriptional acitvator, Baf family [Pseudopedobacter saltans DSM 12145]|uniref:Type III pantothenate kinase n=1 Tax=Pseudopedobacter saltans (strain ATCC 51119 / DSM 12145 / JCM 21818 / CCUG 39354 / LMG 10337 / NBRC 100064 / NCIMB 13643) TaxID=762903 RepID=F0SBC4_PSESL|nr:type III pantothenate kinase [Pseudopedobacter saltans]ADY53751.1 putative transcriptional acitvator, Baf family [Pseudopedobacter saltans DSM 12145]